MPQIEHHSISRDRLNSMPRTPGVYLMKDRQGEVIYIGKAKNLRNRLRSYFNNTDDRYSVPFLLERLREIETLVCADERQAIVLENDLIKKHKPRYNVRLKDDRAHLLVRIDMNHPWPRLDLVRKVSDDGAKYIGPFAFSYELRALLDVIKRTIPLRTCTNKVIVNRVRPCLEYQIKRCSGPCTLPVDRERYLHWLDQAVRLLRGKNRAVIDELETEMERASSELRFEDAAEIRDRLDVLRRVAEDKPAVNFGTSSRDAFGLYREGERAELSVLTVRGGRLLGSKSFGFPDVEVSNAELLPQLLSQFYSESEDIPEEIIVPFELEDTESRRALYSERRGRSVHIITPQRGDRRQLLDLAEQNAKENYISRFNPSISDSVGRALQSDLELEEVPRTVECADISHFQGGSTVGCIVSFLDGKPEKQRYRKFKLSQEGKPDDFASMREMIGRHLSRCAEENTICDLMVIDGGPQQLAMALAQRKELGLSRPMMIGLAKERRARGHYRGVLEPPAKKPERIYFEGRTAPMVLRPGTVSFNFLTRVRDEAHRFAITFHRASRMKRTFTSRLDAIPGIGTERRKELLRRFGTINAILKAGPDEIAHRCRIPKKLAERIVLLLSRQPG
jgi:excinuclease ABC subunit C